MNSLTVYCVVTGAASTLIFGVLASVWAVKIGASRKLILLASLGASAVALPLSLLAGLYAACSLGDCL
jgi:hypothetical protein